jgi:uncharacterized Tic20 family protein
MDSAMTFEDAPPSESNNPDSAPALTSDDRTWAMLAHLSSLIAAALGGMTFLGPLIVWLIKKDQSKFVDYHGKQALNFQINLLIYFVILIGASVITLGVGLIVTGPLMAALGIYALIVTIIAAMKANNGEYYKYPYTWALIK